MFSTMLISENDETNTLSCKEVENQSSDTPIPLLDTNELRNQVGFLEILWLDMQNGGCVR